MKIKLQEPINDDDFYYDFFDGGYLEPSYVLEDQSDIDAVENARRIIELYKLSIEKHNDLYNDEEE